MSRLKIARLPIVAFVLALGAGFGLSYQARASTIPKGAICAIARGACTASCPKSGGILGGVAHAACIVLCEANYQKCLHG